MNFSHKFRRCSIKAKHKHLVAPIFIKVSFYTEQGRFNKRYCHTSQLLIKFREVRTIEIMLILKHEGKSPAQIYHISCESQVTKIIYETS